MTATPPPASGDSPTSDRRVTILAACSVLCTVIALVCLGLLVFTGDKDANATTASTNEATNEADNEATDEEPSTPESSHPDDLTPAGWNSSNVQCKGNDSWIYAATGADGKVLVCIHEEIPYLVDDNGAPDNVDSVWPMCPARGHDPELGRFTVAYGVDGWQQLDGLTMYYYMYMSTGQRSPEGAGDPANVDVTHFDGYWVDDSADYSGLASCDSNHMTMEFRENPDQADSPNATEAAASSETGACDIAQLQHAQTVGSGHDASKMGEIHFCDGRWANIYMWGSGFQSDLLEWNGTEWERRKSDGKTTGGLDNPCYDEDKLKADGVPYGEDDLKLVVCGTNAMRPNPDE